MITDLSGKSLPSFQVNLLKDLSKSIDSLLISSASFSMIDASFYGHSDAMGVSQENLTWEKLQTEAMDINTNYLLLGRQYVDGGKGFKLWIDLNISPNQFKCYTIGEDSLLQANLDTFQIQLEEWFDYFVSQPTDGDFDIQYQVAKLAFQKLKKVCCYLNQGRSFTTCSPELDIQEIANERDLKYYILGKIKCLSFTENCNDYPITPGIELGAIKREQLIEDEFSYFKNSDRLDILNDVHIYFPEYTTSSIRCSPIISSSYRRTIDLDRGDISVPVNVYDFGQFIVVLHEGRDLVQLLKGIREDLKRDIPTLINYGAGHGSRPDDSFKRLNYVSECDFFELEEFDKIRLLEFIVSDKVHKWHDLFRWWDAKYAYFILNLYNEIGRNVPSDQPEKAELFEYQKAGRGRFVVDFLNYNYPSSYESYILHKYCQDYVKYAQGSLSEFTGGDTKNSKLYFIPYEVDKFYGFYLTNYDYVLVNGRVDIEMEQITTYQSGTQSAPDISTHKIKTLDLLDPVVLPKVDVLNIPGIQYNLLPAAILLKIEEYIESENQFQTLIVSAEVAGVLAGAGVFTGLAKLGRIGLFLKGVEVSSGVVNSVITHTDAIPASHAGLKKKIVLYLTCLEMVSGLGPDAAGILTSIRNYGKEALDDAISANKVSSIVNDDVPTFIARTLGKDGLLSRIPESGPLRTFVSSLDEVRDIETINKLNSCSTPLLLRLNDLKPAQNSLLYSKFADDIADANFLKVMNEHPDRVRAWKGLSNRLPWVRTNTDLLEKLAGKSDDYIAKVDEIYSPTVMKLPPNLKPPNGNCPGSYNGIDYDKYGFPKLESHVSDQSHIVKIDLDVDVPNNDYLAAYDKLKDIVGESNIQFTNQYGSSFKIRQADGTFNGPAYTWHHHQDGESMMPVLQTVHQSIQSYHTGGRAVAKRGLVGLFDPPQ